MIKTGRAELAARIAGDGGGGKPREVMHQQKEREAVTQDGGSVMDGKTAAPLSNTN